MSESVESIVDKYMKVWDYSYKETLHEITHNFEMDPGEIEAAHQHLKKKYQHKRE